MSNAKILILDIETSPHLAYVWRMWKQNINPKAWVEKSHIMSFSAKWLGSKEMIYEENRTGNDKKLVKSLFDLLDQADIVVAHNGQKFDLPRIIGRGLVHNYSPPSPYFVVDTLLVARREFDFVSNTLSALCEELGLAKKGDHKKYPGFELWIACMAGEDAAWKEMQVYNEQDVISLEGLYLRMLPYIRNHPNVVRDEEGDIIACAKCGSENIQWRGYYYTKSGLCYKRFVCMDCGGWGRVRYAERDKGKNLGTNAA